MLTNWMQNLCACLPILAIGAISSLTLPSSLHAQIDVLYSEIATDDSSIIPGAKDIMGQSILARFSQLQNFGLSPDGSQWYVRGVSDQGIDEKNVLLIGSDLSGSVLAQEGQMAPGSGNEVFDFFDAKSSFDSTGKFAFGCRTRGGPSTDREKFFSYAGGALSLTLKQGDLAPGLIDLPPSSSGDEQLGSSLSSINLLDNGEVAVIAFTIDHLHDSRRPALVTHTGSIAQSGVSLVEGHTWTNFVDNLFFVSPDQAHWLAVGNISLTGSPEVLVKNGQKMLIQGQQLDNSNQIVLSITSCSLAPNGDWFAFGRGEGNLAWGVAYDELVIESGMPILPGSNENWSHTVFFVCGNDSGDYVCCGLTDNPDPDLENVLVWNGTHEILRSNAPIDLNGDGFFNDDTYIRNFKSNAALSSDRKLFVTVTLQDSLGTILGDAFLRINIPVAIQTDFIRGDVNMDSLLNIADAISVLSYLFPSGPFEVLDCSDSYDVNDDGEINIADTIKLLGVLFPGGSPVQQPNAPYPNCGQETTDDPLGCIYFDAC